MGVIVLVVIMYLQVVKMRYRKLDDDGDMIFGHGEADYWIDTWEGVLQAIVTRLKLWRGEWFMDTEYGTPWAQEILGKTTQLERDTALEEVILDTQGVTDLEYFNAEFNREIRDYIVSFSANTMYGQVQGSGAYGTNSVYR